MGRIGGRGLLIGAALIVAIGAASASALVFQGRDDAPAAHSASRATTTNAPTTTSTSTTSTTTTSTTTTTAPPPPPPPPATDPPAPTPAPAPAPAPTPVVVVPPPPATPACDGGGSGVIDAMNGDRAANGLGGLCGNSQLAGIAQNWANWMAANSSLTHQNLASLFGGLPFNSLAENILEGPGSMSVSAMESAWMQSPGHRANILNGTYTASGVGIAYGPDGRVWVAVEFGG